MVTRLFAPVALAALAACAGAPPRAFGPWPRQTPAERLAYMTEVVTPRMQAVLARHDAHRYPRVTCATCHGKSGPARGYAMPNPDLLLEPTPWNTGAAEPAGAGSAMEAFMAREVLPELRRLVGPEATRAGCFVCHVREE